MIVAGQVTAVEIVAVIKRIEEDSTSLELLHDADLLYEKVGQALRCPPQHAEIALREVIRFLCLVADSDTGILTPSRPVDLAWHELILFTRVYMNFCDEFFGRYIHHTPARPDESNLRQYERTLQQYQERFGPADIRFWPNPTVNANCGACETE